MSISPVLDRPATKAARLGVVDCDIHPAPSGPEALKPFLSDRWWRHLSTYGGHVRQGLLGALAHPRMWPGSVRLDAWTPEGRYPGSDVNYLSRHHLDANGIDFGMMIALAGSGCDERNLEFGAALCTALNDWQRAVWVDAEPRLRAGIAVAQEFPESAVAEIERLAGDPAFVQVLVPPRTDEPLGRRRYWPIYAAAERAGRPVTFHISGIGGHPSTGAGWSTYFFQEHHSCMTTGQTVLSSLVLEGVFERFPRLKIVLVEASFTWVPAFCWRMDRHWERMRDETPHLTRPPSEYVRDHFWFTTQPIEEPERPQDLATIIDWIGWDRILFSTDYPHWDSDDPRFAFKCRMSEAQKRMIFRENAIGLYGLV